jgi:hypothetical protein
VIAGPRASGAAEPALDLVEDEQRPVLVAEPAKPPQEAVFRDYRAGVALHRLHEHARRRVDPGRGIGEQLLEHR